MKSLKMVKMSEVMNFITKSGYLASTIGAQKSMILFSDGEHYRIHISSGGEARPEELDLIAIVAGEQNSSKIIVVDNDKEKICMFGKGTDKGFAVVFIVDERGAFIAMLDELMGEAVICTGTDDDGMMKILLCLICRLAERSNCDIDVAAIKSRLLGGGVNSGL